jgi:hypothetical protein
MTLAAHAAMSEHRVQIACFVAEVLLRKLKKARDEYIKKSTRVRSRTNKIKRADEFCLGLVCTLLRKNIFELDFYFEAWFLLG